MRVAISAAAPATSGASSAGTATFDTTPVQSTPLVPTAASTDPTMPPISAWLDDDGMPEIPGENVPDDRADQAREDDLERDVALRDDALGDRRRNADREERADEIEDGGHSHGHARTQCAGRNRRGHRVRGVVKAVGEIEPQGRHDHDHEQSRRLAHGAVLPVRRTTGAGITIRAAPWPRCASPRSSRAAKLSGVQVLRAMNSAYFST